MINQFENRVTPIDQSQYGRRLSAYADSLDGQTLTMLDERGRVTRTVAKSQIVHSAVLSIRSNEVDDDGADIPLLLVRGAGWGLVIVLAIVGYCWLAATYGPGIAAGLRGMGR